jgi:DNA-directed RNA polymerase specialized sigma24 family protein
VREGGSLGDTPVHPTIMDTRRVRGHAAGSPARAWRACQRVPSPTFTTAAYGAKNALMDYGRALGRYSRAGVDRKVEAGISLDDPDVVWEVSGLEDDLTQFEVLGRLERLEERDRVIALMTYLGFTQDEIADQLGVTASRISQLLGGRISRELSRAA